MYLIRGQTKPTTKDTLTIFSTLANIKHLSVMSKDLQGQVTFGMMIKSIERPPLETWKYPLNDIINCMNYNLIMHNYK